MPLYEFINERTGMKLEVPFAVEDRPEELIFRRLKVPRQVVLKGVSPRSDDYHANPNAGMLHAYHQLEQREGARFQSEFTPEQIKQAWTSPDPKGIGQP